MKVNPNINISYEVNLTLSEIEARAFFAIVSYGFEEFLNVFYKHLGKGTLKDNEKGAKLLFESVRTAISEQICSIDKARRLIKEEVTDKL
jgi:hypothetical protein